MLETSYLSCVIYVCTAVLGIVTAQRPNGRHDQTDTEYLMVDAETYKAACPEYQNYAAFPHRPLSTGPLALPFQRPYKACRTFTAPSVEKVIEDFTSRMDDKDLARLFENAFPNTLDTTVRWHVDGHQKKSKANTYPDGAWDGPQSFIVTGDINAEWLRDSTNQLAQYQALAPKDEKLKLLILGAINTQAEYVIASPYCNAFQPPPPSKLGATMNGQDDVVHPAYEPSLVFECKYELDSLAHFLALGNRFYNNTKSTAFMTGRWLLALSTVMTVLEEQSKSTFNETTGSFEQNQYRFSRKTTVGTETLNLGGTGNPLNSGTGLVRSAFRPSDDATTFGFFIPANAMMAVELKRTAAILKLQGKEDLAKTLLARAQSMDKGIREHGVITHKKYGEVFAFEVDGYGSQIMMDDANLPSLLALPLLGYAQSSDETYQNTRKMILEQAGNPYYLSGKAFPGIGGPHIGLQFAWPMSRLVQAMTSEDDDEIKSSLQDVLKSSKLGLVHESINVNMASQYTRIWFAWANSVFAQTILDLAARKPHLVFGEDGEAYRLSDVEV